MRRIFTDYEINFIKENKDNIEYKQIAKILNRTEKSIQQKIYKMGLSTKDNNKSLLRNELTKNKLYDLYINQNISYGKIAKIYNTTAGNIQYIAKTYGIISRNLTECSLVNDCYGRRNKFNFNFFKEETKEKYYILGLLATDGYVNSKNNTVGLTLIDEDVINNIKTIIKYEAPIKIKEYTDKQTTYTILFSHYNTKKDLEKYNIVPKKSKIIKYPIIPNEFKKYFIRGLFEGDGWYSVAKRKKHPFITFGFVSASEDFIDDLKNDLKNLGYDFVKRNSNTYFTLRLNIKSQSRKFGQWLYEDCEKDGLYMLRKFNKIKYFDEYIK